MPKGNQTKNFEFLGSYSDKDYVGEFLCDDVEFRFDLYAPDQKGAGTAVGWQSQGKGNFDFVWISPGLHVEVFVSEDGGDFDQVATWNVSGPITIDFLENGGTALDFKGHGLISDRFDSGTPDVKFLKYAVGNFRYVGDADNNAIEDLHGHGQLLDLADTFC